MTHEWIGRRCCHRAAISWDTGWFSNRLLKTPQDICDDHQPYDRRGTESQDRRQQEESASQQDVLQHLPCLTAHLIAESLGYFTPKSAANAIAYFTKGEAFYCEWYYDWASKRFANGGTKCADVRSTVKEVGELAIRNAVHRRSIIVARWPSSSGRWPWCFTFGKAVKGRCSPRGSDGRGHRTRRGGGPSPPVIAETVDTAQRMKQSNHNMRFAMPDSKAHPQIVMSVFCLEEDAEDVKTSLFSDDGECWFYDQDFLLGNIKVEIVEPTDDEEREARDVLDVGDDGGAGTDTKHHLTATERNEPRIRTRPCATSIPAAGKSATRPSARRWTASPSR